MLIAGAGGFALQLLDDLETVFGTELVFWTNREVQPNAISAQYRIVATEEAVQSYFREAGNGFILGIGGPENRRRLQQYFEGLGGTLNSFLSPAATISRYAQIGPGTVVAARAVLEAGVVTGTGVLINTGAILTHECRIGDYTEIAPAVALGGKVQIGQYCFAGLNATVLPGVHIGDRSIIGAGAVVTRSFPGGGIIKGVPAV